MDEFTIKLFLLDEFTLQIAGFGLIVLGAVLGAVFLTVKRSFRRVHYLWWIATATIVFSLSQIGWLTVGIAAEVGMMTPMVILLIISSLMFGMAVYYCSAARAININGSPRMAWLAFVPLANLWLLLKAPQEEQGVMGVSGGPKVSKLSNTILILGALFLVLMSRYIDAQTAKADLVGGERLTTFLQLRKRTYG